MSGPVIGTNNFGTAWGSAIGALVTWEPFDFGLRQANVRRGQRRARPVGSRLEATQFEVAVAAADAYLTLAAAQETVRAAQAGVDRAETCSRTINALVNAQLRPGADASRAEAEAGRRAHAIDSGAAGRRSRARQSSRSSSGVEPAQIAIAAPRLLRIAARAHAAAPLDTAANPLAVEQNAVVEQAQAQLRRWSDPISRASTCKARPTRAAPARKSTARFWAGSTASRPTFRITPSASPSRFRVRSAAHRRRAKPRNRPPSAPQTARSQQIATDLRAQWNVAVATLEGARSVAANTPVQVAAARAALAAGDRPLSVRPRQHRRSRRSAAAAHPGRNRRRAGPPRRLARPARRRHRRGRHPAVPGRGWASECVSS